MSKRRGERSSRRPKNSSSKQSQSRRQSEQKEGFFSKLSDFFQTNRKRIILLSIALLTVEEATIGGIRKQFSDTVDNTPAATAPVKTGEPKAEELTSAESSIEKKKYQFEIDGFRVESDTVPPEDFKKAYAEAKEKLGGIYWQPEKLSVEYGNVAKDHFKDVGFMQLDGMKASWTSDNLDEIITVPVSLTHELAHFLIGPEGKKWPLLLQEIMASVASDRTGVPKYNPKVLDRPWVQMPIAESIVSGWPLTGARYAAIEDVAKKHVDKIPSIVQQALERNDITFENLADFMAQFDIEHHILHPGETGQFNEIIEYKDSEKEGFVYFRYNRTLGEGTEHGWIGPLRPIFKDDAGRVYEGPVMNMQGFVFIPPPPNPLSPLVAVQIQHQDGTYTRDLE